MLTASMIPSIMSGSLIRLTPPCARMSAGTRSSAITATAPASSAIFACSGVTTSMMTPPFSISAMPRFTRVVPVVASVCSGVPAMGPIVRRSGRGAGIGGGLLGHHLLVDHVHPERHGVGAREGQGPEGEVHQHGEVEDRPEA